MIFSQKEIYERVKEQFRQRGFDVEFGSNIQQIQNSMQYLVSMLNQNTQINVKETILSSQTKRNMILEDARMFGYEQIPKRSYEYNLMLSIINPTSNDAQFSLGFLDEFESDGKKFYYIGPIIDETIQPNDENSPRLIEIKTVKEGVLHRQSETPELNHTTQMMLTPKGWVPEEFFDLPFTNVQEDGIFIKTTDLYGNIFTWTQQDALFLEKNSILDKQYIRQDDIETGMPRIYFRYGNWGEELPIGTNIEVDVLVSNGSEGSSSGNFSISKNFGDLEVEIISNTIQYTGSDEETDESIKINQPLFDNAQGRIVTYHDYKQIQSRQPSVKHQQVWDGMEEIEKLQGYIWFSFVNGNRQTKFSDTIQDNNKISPIPNRRWVLQGYFNDDNNYVEDNDWQNDGSTISQTPSSNVQKIFAYIRQYQIPTLKYNYRQPVFLDFDIKVIMQQYNQQQPMTEQDEDVYKQVRDFFTGEKTIEKFDTKFFSQEFTDYIYDNTLADTMFDIEVNTSIFLTQRHIVRDEVDENCLVFRLGSEFATIDAGGLVLQNLPNIHTTNFYNSEDLLMPQDLNDFNPVGNKTWVQKLYLGSNEIGEYRVFGNANAVEIMLKTEDIEDALIKLPENQPSYDPSIEPFKGLRVNVKYPTPNISVKKNTVIRLNSIEIAKA